MKFILTRQAFKKENGKTKRMMAIIPCLLVFLLINCTKHSYDENVPIEIKTQIRDTCFISQFEEYCSYVKQQCYKGEHDSLYIAMYHYPVNDSITKYALLGVITPSQFEYYPPQNIFNINQQKVFYTRLDPPRMDFANKRMSQEEYASFMEEYFPVAYQSYSNLGYIYPQYCFEPDVLHMYYLNDSLIYSIQQPGLPTDMCNLVLNGKEVWM